MTTAGSAGRRLRALCTGLLGSVVAAVLVASLASARDWYLDPAGIFHGAGGTDWSVVGATWWSWFLPAAAGTALLLVPLSLLLTRRS